MRRETSTRQETTSRGPHYQGPHKRFETLFKSIKNLEPLKMASEGGTRFSGKLYFGVELETDLA